MDPSGTASTMVLVVRAGGRRLGLPVPLVRRVVRDLEVSPVPGSAPRFAGLAQLGGEAVPVLDLAVVVGSAEPTGARSRLVVVVELPGRGDGQTLALAVDAAVGLETIPAVSGGDSPVSLELFDPSRLELGG